MYRRDDSEGACRCMKKWICHQRFLFFGIGIGISASLSFLFFYTLTAKFSAPILIAITISVVCFSIIYRELLPTSNQHSVHTLIVSAAITFECLSLLPMLPFSNKTLPELREFLFSYVAIFITTFAIIFVCYVTLFIFHYAIGHKARLPSLGYFH